MANSFRYGQVLLKPDSGLFVVYPKMELLPRVIEIYDGYLQQYPDETTVRNSYTNFMRDAIVTLYTFNRIERAQNLFENLRTKFPSPDLDIGFSEYVLGSLASDLSNLSRGNAVSLVEGAYFQSYFWLAVGDEDRSEGFRNLASLAWSRYTSGKPDEEISRLGLPSLAEIERRALERARAEVKSPDLKGRLGDVLP
jgi:hypothetical protein